MGVGWFRVLISFRCPDFFSNFSSSISPHFFSCDAHINKARALLDLHIK